MNLHQFEPSIIRAYDIRGIYNETLFDQDAYFLGKSFAYFLKQNNKHKIAVGNDGRNSSSDLKKHLIKGLTESGIDVIDVGLGPTPMLYFSVYELKLDAGIMVTGSHNPKNHNGFKMTLKERPFFGEDIIKLAKIAETIELPESEVKGSCEKYDIKNSYVERLLEDSIIPENEGSLLDEIDEFTPKKSLKIAWDSGNGSAGEIMQNLTKRISGEHFLLFENIDGNFPNHHPDPTVPKNLEDLIKTVREKNCDLGIAFDGDGDRIGLVDNEGEIIWGDQLMIFYARAILQEIPNATIIADVKASNILFDEVRNLGGNAIMGKTGHSFIKSKMKETNAKLAGEMSGHIFFADKYFGFDDALYAAIRILNIVYSSNISLAQMRKELPKSFSTSEIRIDCEEKEKFAIVGNLKTRLKEQNIIFNDVDGIRTNSEIGWWLLRASNTQSCLVARCEANSLKNLNKLKNQLVENLESLGIQIII